MFSLQFTWITLAAILAIILFSLGALNYMSNYLKCFQEIGKAILQGIRFNYIMRWFPNNELMLALDYFIGAYYNHSPVFKVATALQAAHMIVAAYLPDKNIKPEELKGITDFLINRKFKVSKMLETAKGDIPAADRLLVDTLVPAVEDIAKELDTPITDLALPEIKNLIDQYVPTVGTYTKEKIHRLKKINLKP